MATIEQKAGGCFAGLGTGDALGATLEFTTASQVSVMELHTEIIGGGPFNVAAGEVTDDTQMAMALAESLIALGRFDAGDVAARYLEWFAGGPADVGSTIAETLRELRRGTPVGEAARRVDARFGGMTGGNGALMRSAPLALFLHDDAGALFEASLEEARITHWDPAAGLTSAYANVAIARLLGGGTLEESLAAAAAAVEGRDGRVDALAAEIAERRTPRAAPGGYCVDTLRAAAWGVSTTATFEEALVAVVNLGGDSDTTGAVAGALAGALYGIDGIPRRWLETLRPRARLEELSEGLLAAGRRRGQASSDSMSGGRSRIDRRQ